MCAVGHFLEEEGLATVSITLVRPHVEKIEPPRSLWVPFELGRPLGVPNDAAFQRQVLLAALRLLESDDGPVLLADYREDAPASATGDMTGWACPVALKAPPADAGQSLAEALVEEIGSLRPWHDMALKARGRTTVGVSGIDVAAAGRFVASHLTDHPEPSYRPDLAMGDALKLATEDIKAFYLEAATAQPGKATSAELADWFWGETTAGKVFLALKRVCLESDDPVAKAMGTFTLVPRSQLHRLDDTAGS